MVDFDFKESLGDKFGSFTNSLFGAAIKGKELSILEKQSVNGSSVQDRNQQTPAPVNNNGAPVNQSAGTVGGVKASTLVYLGLGVVAIGGAVAIAKYA